MRINLLIGPRLQLRFLIVAMFCNLVVSAGFLFASYRFIDLFKQKATAVGIPSSHFFFSFMNDQASLLYTLVGIGCFFSVVIVSVCMLYLTHKIAGPVYRIKSDLEAMLATGELKPIQLRDRDELQEVVTLLNAILAKFKKAGLS